MADTVITHKAQKLNIECMRGNHFKLVVKIKNAAGSDYDFHASDDGVATDQCFIRILQRGANNQYTFNLFNSPYNVEIEIPQGTPDPNISYVNVADIIHKTIQDGKLTFEWDPIQGGTFAPWPGRYKYYIYTHPGNTGGNDNWSEHIWLYGDFIVKASNPWDPTPLGLTGSDIFPA